MLFGFNNPRAPHNKKNKNNHKSIGRAKAHSTKMSQENKKITTRKIPATNNTILVRTGSLRFFKKYRQPVSKKFSTVAKKITITFFSVA